MKRFIVKLILLFIFDKEKKKKFKEKYLTSKLYAKFKRRSYPLVISSLFEKYPHKEYATLKALDGVNAAFGVTEQSIVKLLQYKQGSKLLSVGCGMHNQSEYLSDVGFDFHGVDIDVKNDTDKLKWHNLNEYNNLPFDEKMFDVVLSQEVIEHIENPWLLIRKIKRVLKKDGYLILTTPNNSSLKSKKIFSKSDVGFTRYFNANDLWQHINPLQIFELQHMLKYNNFDIVEVTGSDEFYYDFSPKELSKEKAFKNTVKYNDVLHFVCKNLDNEIKEYIPESTYEKTT